MDLFITLTLDSEVCKDESRLCWKGKSHRVQGGGPVFSEGVACLEHEMRILSENLLS